MKKLFPFYVLFLIILLSAFHLISESASADGMLLDYDPYADRFDFSKEDNQQAFINYEKGRQKMIISIGLENDSENLVWIFPVPSNPTEVNIDVISDLPELQGEEISKKAESNLEAAANVLIYTQFFLQPRSMISGVMLEDRNSYGSSDNQDVTVYASLEKEGISSELVTAATADGLYDYLKSKDLKIESGTVPALDSYIGKDYSFVISWISSAKYAGPSVQKGIFIEFPTEDLYFPLIPTSVYGEVTVPATIRVMGHVSPIIFEGIRRNTDVEYYISGKITLNDTLGNFYSGDTTNIKYTKIDIEAPSDYFTEDLWISRETSARTRYTIFLAEHKGIVAILLLLISSIVAGVFVGMILFKDLRNSPEKLAMIGLSNCFTLLGLIIVTFLVNTKNISPELKPVLSELREKGYHRTRLAARFILSLGEIIAFFGIIMIPSLLMVIIQSIKYGDFAGIFPLIFSLYLPPAILISFAHTLGDIKHEDRPLFEKLKKANYSTWSFQPKDGRKIWFIFFFSISFLFISLSLVSILKSAI